MMTEQAASQPFLKPIERPSGARMKLLFAWIRRSSGAVFMPLRVFSSRLPIDFFDFYTRPYKLDKKLSLPIKLRVIVRQHVARINACHFCIRAGQWAAASAGIDPTVFDALSRFESADEFSEAEKAALAYATELTRDRTMTRATFERVARRYSDREICELVYLVATEHLFNLTNIGLNIRADDAEH